MPRAAGSTATTTSGDAGATSRSSTGSSTSPTALPGPARADPADLRRCRACPARRVLACAARLLDLGFFRIGGEEYAEQNNSPTVWRRCAASTPALDPAARSRSTTSPRAASSGCSAVARSRGLRGGRARCCAPRTTRPGAAGLPRRGAALGRREERATSTPTSRRRPAASDHGQGLPHLVGDRAVRGRAGRVRERGDLPDRGASGPSPGPSGRSPTTSATRPRSAARRTSHPRVIDLFLGGVTIAEDLESIGDGSGYGHLAVQGDVEAAVSALLRSPQAARAASRRRRLQAAREQRATSKARSSARSRARSKAPARAAARADRCRLTRATSWQLCRTSSTSWRDATFCPSCGSCAAPLSRSGPSRGASG